MVKKFEETASPQFKDEIISTSTERSNGTSYADSLKSDLKKRQSNDDVSSSTSELNDKSTDFINGNGLLNELVVNVSNNVLHQQQQQTSNNITSHKQINNDSTMQLSNNGEVKKRATLISETFKKTPSTIPSEIDCIKNKIRTSFKEPVDQSTLSNQSDSIEVTFFIKNIIEDTLDVDFQEKSLMFKFKTTDSSFLRFHNFNSQQFKTTYTNTRIVNGTINGSQIADNRFNQLKPEIDKSKLPLFVYEVKTLFDKVVPKDCKYELTENHLKIKLKKKTHIKWNELESVTNEMGTNFLRNVAKVQKVDDTFKYKAPQNNKLNNVNKLINGYEKITNNIQTNNQTKDKNDIPVPPALPKEKIVHQRLVTDVEPKFNSLLISPMKLSTEEDEEEECPKVRKPIPLKFEPEESSEISKPSQSVVLKLNLAEARGKIGYTGLSNLGNTCYMNSCLQCLSNTVELRDYFLNGDYKEDLNPNNIFGSSNGNLAESFSEVLYQLWCGDSSYFSPTRFKRLIDENCSQFIGYSQHDSVEFMEHFLDVLHEDLNRVDRRNIQPAEPIENEDELSDEQLADEQWKRHKDRNDSIITKLFYGQYKSKLVCPVCSKVSLVFDPFLYLPIPLTKNKITYNYYFFSLDINQPPKRMSIKLPQGSKVLNLLEDAASKIGLSRFQLIACQINQSGEVEQEYNRNSFLPDQPAKAKKIYVYEKSEDKCADKFVVHQTVPAQQTQTTSISGFDSLEKCEYCNRPMGKAIFEDIINCKCGKVKYCNEKCRRSDELLHEPKCKKTDQILVGWPSILFFDNSRISYDGLMNMLEKSALTSVEVVETEVEEEDTQVHLGQEIKEGQLDLDATKEASEKINNDKQTVDDDDEMDVCPQEESTESSQPNVSASTTTDDSFGKENNSTENSSHDEEIKDKEEIEDSTYRFILRGKRNDMGLSKETIYVPKDDSLHEVFRKSLRDYYYLYVDWKDKYTKVDEETGKRKTYALSVQSKNLNLVATFADGSFASEADQKNDITLNDLITKFTEPETLSAQDSWVCPKCKEPRTASKELTIWRPPQILVIQLKRFSYSSYSREKIDKFVNYPTKGLDISKFCTDPKLLNQKHKPIYDLYAVIQHFGGLFGGHYTAQCTGQRTGSSTVSSSSGDSTANNQELGWRTFNDSSVRDCDEESAVSRSAYVLFYRLRDQQDSSSNKSD